MNIVFLGATRLSLLCLKAITQIPDIDVTGVLTAPKEFNISYSPDRPVTNFLHADIQAFCGAHEIKVAELNGKMNDCQTIEWVKGCQPDFIVVIGWYHMVPKVIREIPPLGVAGIHASLLPCYRGGAPLVWALIQGESKVGLSLFYLEEGVDTGDILGQVVVPVNYNDNIRTVYNKVEAESERLLADILPKLHQGNRLAKPQSSLPPGHPASWPQRKPEDGVIDWHTSPLAIYNFIRAQTRPYPGAFTAFRGHKLTIWEGKLFDYLPYCGEAGEILDIIKTGPLQGLLVATRHGDCPILVTEVEFAGEALSGLDFSIKYQVDPGLKFGRSELKQPSILI